MTFHYQSVLFRVILEYPTEVFMKLHLTLIALTVFSASALSQSSEAIRKYIESISAGVPTEVQGQLIHSTTLLPEFYFENQFQRVWTRPLQASFLGLVRRAYEHG